MKQFLASILLFGWVAQAQAQSDLYQKLTFKVGAGATISPGGVLGVASADYRISENIAVTSMLQWSLGEIQDIVFPSFGGRIILPKSVINGNSTGGTGLELSALFGAGPVYREVNGFRSSLVGFHAGLGLDIFLSKNLSFGGTALANFTSNVVEDTYYSLFGHVGFHF